MCNRMISVIPLDIGVERLTLVFRENLILKPQIEALNELLSVTRKTHCGSPPFILSVPPTNI